MKILFINTVCGITSTGRIACELADKLEAQGNQCKVAYGRNSEVPEKWQKYAVRIGDVKDNYWHVLLTRFFDASGFGSKKATANFLKWADKYNPDVLWLHNLHGYYINIEMLFEWIKKRPNMIVKWTLHDCWSFTGHCSYFTLTGCEKWKTQCQKCCSTREYPKSCFFDNSKENFDRKKSAFTGVKNMTLITPSNWLANLVKQSFLKEYSVEVHYNKIDTNIFKRADSDFKVRNNLSDKNIILGVSNGWDARKGYADFIKLAQLIDKEKYVIVLVGVSKNQKKELPDNIVGIEKTNNVQELVEIYSSADIYFNPTYEDNYPTVNLEAEACGTPVVTYATGGSPETIKRDDSAVIPVGNVSGFVEILKKRYEN